MAHVLLFFLIVKCMITNSCGASSHLTNERTYLPFSSDWSVWNICFRHETTLCWLPYLKISDIVGIWLTQITVPNCLCWTVYWWHTPHVLLLLLFLLNVLLSLVELSCKWQTNVVFHFLRSVNLKPLFYVEIVGIVFDVVVVVVLLVN